MIQFGRWILSQQCDILTKNVNALPGFISFQTAVPLYSELVRPQLVRPQLVSSLITSEVITSEILLVISETSTLIGYPVLGITF